MDVKNPASNKGIRTLREISSVEKSIVRGLSEGEWREGLRDKRLREERY